MKRIKRMKNCPRLPRCLMGIGEKVEDFFIVGNHQGFLVKMANGGYAFAVICRTNKDVNKAFKYDVRDCKGDFLTNVKTEYEQQKQKYLELLNK